MRQALRHVRDEALRNQKSAMIADIKQINLEAKIKQENEQMLKFQETKEQKVWEKMVG